MSDIRRLLLLVLILGLSAWLEAQQNLAGLRLYAFSPEGLPVRGVEVRVDDIAYTSDVDGVLELQDTPGVHTYTVNWLGRRAGVVKVALRTGMTIEIILTVRLDLPADAIAEETGPALPASAQTPTEAQPAAPPGTLSGVVVHFETRKPIAGATILVRGVATDARTDANGRYTITIPSGPHTVSIIHPQFATQTKEEVAVKADADTVLDFDLTPSAFQMEAMQIVSTEDIQVLGGVAALTDETKNSGVVLNLMGSEQISKSGDSDAAGALSRVTGLTVVGGKYVYVRGMGERYSASYMNGARLPSPELDRRVVPLDLFPTAVIESLAIQKTYSPELYGDFSGGAVTVRTIGVPNDRFLRRLRGSVGLSLGFNLDNLFQVVDFQQTSATDWLGFDDGTRKLPVGVDPDVAINEAQLGGAGYTADEMTALGKLFPNVWAPVQKMLLPDVGVTFSLKDKVDLDRLHRLGWAAALMYKHQMGLDAEINRQFGDNLGRNQSLDTVTTTSSQEVDWSGLLNVEFDAEREFHLRSTTLWTRITNDEFSLTRGFQKEIIDEKIYDASWVEQSLLNQAVAADWQGTLFVPLKVHTQYSLSLASRYEPDHRLIGFGSDDKVVFDVTNKAGNSYRLFLSAQDIIHDAAASLTLPFPFFGEATDQIALGGQYIRQNRTVTNNRYTYQFGTGTVTTDGLDTILLPDRLGNGVPGKITFFENTKPSDNYKGTHTVFGGYANADLLLLGWLRSNLGVRVEQSTQVIDTYQLGQVLKIPTQVILSNLTYLPSLNFTVPVNRQTQARFGVSRTVNRPDFIEISNTIKEGLPGNGLYKGNPALVSASIWNADLRLEQYLNPTESWSLGSFAKTFTNPIEVTESNGTSGEKGPTNVPSATNWGLELEWNLTGGAMADWLRGRSLAKESKSTEEFFWDRQSTAFWGAFLRDISTTGNLSWIQSQIDYGSMSKGNNTSSVRPLQGQSPWVINLGLSYKNSASWSQVVRSDTSVSLSYNVFGPRLKRIGTGTLLDSYEQPFHQLDLVVKHRFDETWSLDFKAKNLFDLPLVETAGDLILSSQQKGRTFSIAGKYDF